MARRNSGLSWWWLVALGLGLAGCGPLVAEVDADRIAHEPDPGPDQQQPLDEQCVAAELCANGVDDDCDGFADCTDSECADFKGCCIPSSELCNGLDDDCDDVIDNGIADLGQPCTFGVGACATSGQFVCTADSRGVVCSAIPRAPSAEDCSNGSDDDCDGQTDCNDTACAGQAVCQTCTPRAELCNGVDDDCDGVVDNGFANLGQACQAGVGACAASGHYVCAASGTGTVCNASPAAPGAERCSNGIDDDCDGSVDCRDSDCRNTEACRVPCEESEGHNCNADEGHGDACAPEDNNGCSAAKFWAWCNRRNTALGCNDGDDSDCIWEIYLRNWVDARCDNSSIALFDLDGSGYSEFVCTGSDGFTYTCTTPLVLAFDGSPVSYRSDDGQARFDLSAAQDGSALRTDWPTAATPWLALDRDGDGRITSGRELFGSASWLGERTADNGFEALAALDGNRDRIIDRRDAAFGQLLVWADRDGDRASAAGELQLLASSGVIAIELGYQVAARCDDRGNCEVERATLVWRDRQGALQRGAVVDVHLAVHDPATPALACR